jgi:hypothetical protein
VKITILIKVPETTKEHITHLVGLLKSTPQYRFYPPSGETGWIELRADEGDPEITAFLDYCRTHRIRSDIQRWVYYTKQEMDAAAFLIMKYEPLILATDLTRYSSETACPKCGEGRVQTGPLIFPVRKTGGKRIFLLRSDYTWHWVVDVKATQAIQSLTGYRLGEVRDSESPDLPCAGFHQLIVDGYLPRMAKATNFVRNGQKLCSCNRSGWTLQDIKIYSRSALREAKDFNWSAERWSGGGHGLNWLVVSQAVRQVMLRNKLLKEGNFEPVQLVDSDPDSAYKFDLPLDAPSSVSGINV